MNDDFRNMTDNELEDIVRQNINSNVPTSRFSYAKNEIEIRYRKKMQEIATRGSGVNIVANQITNTGVIGNTVIKSSNKAASAKESFLSKFFWQFIVALIVLVVGALILNHFFGLK